MSNDDIFLDDDVVDKLESVAKSRNISVDELINDALQHYIRNFLDSDGEGCDTEWCPID